VPESIASEVERFLRTGETDPIYAAWPGGVMERARRAHDDLRRALVDEVNRFAEGRSQRALPGADTVALTRRKVEPMVRGLFPRVEQEAVLGVLEKSVVFITSENVEPLLLGQAFDSSAWDLANLYLTSVGAKLLGDGATRIVGLSEEITCYVSPDFFAQGEPFADFVVHEAAHIFHNCKRRTVGLPETRTREWLLDIEFRKRETFAYSCEAFARVLERGRAPADRRQLADEFAKDVRISNERVDPAEIGSIVQAAAAVRNGWKVILARRAPTVRPRSAVAQARAAWAGEDAYRARASTDDSKVPLASGSESS
jgi:hypothetical protein